MPIASNTARFKSKEVEKVYDIVTTSNNWGSDREIVLAMQKVMVSTKYTYAAYGIGWEQHPFMSQFTKGKASYLEMSDIYSQAKLLIDDAVVINSCKPMGSMNSRVFDALASGTLVITNNVVASNEMFAGKLPYFKDTNELASLANYYITHDKERIQLANTLQQIIVENNSYEHRAKQLQQLVSSYYEENNLRPTQPATIPSRFVESVSQRRNTENSAIGNVSVVPKKNHKVRKALPISPRQMLQRNRIAKNVNSRTIVATQK